jgi:DNA-binding MarR family transcriptional regulator
MKGHPTYYDKDWYLNPVLDAIHGSPGITLSELMKIHAGTSYQTMIRTLKVLIDRGEIIETVCREDRRRKAYMAQA